MLLPWSIWAIIQKFLIFFIQAILSVQYRSAKIHKIKTFKRVVYLLSSGRSLIYGLVFSNIIITVLSYISLEQAISDKDSANLIFLQNIFNFDINLFLTGTSLLYIDAILLIIIYEILNFKIKGKLFFKIFTVTSLISLFDSTVFYSLNFYASDEFLNLLIGNIIGNI